MQPTDLLIEKHPYVLGMIIAVYAFNLMLPPAVAWAIWMYWTMKKLMHMHEYPERTGFGTVGMDDVIELNTTAVNALSLAVEAQTQYIKWMCENVTGRTPPPPIIKTKKVE